ncbi:MAG: hypothetical protein RR515_05860, partial [Clostridium sp.]
MSEILAFTVLMAILAFGDVISTATKAKIPSVFVISIVAIAGFWSNIIPTDILYLTGISLPLIYVFYYLQLPHMGALMSVKEMLQQWKTILICIAGIVGIAVFTLTIGTLLFGWETVVVGTPPLAGGIVAVEIMKTAAFEKGLDSLGLLAIGVFVLQGFVGYPLTAALLKKEANRLLKEFRVGNMSIDSNISTISKTSKKKLLPQLPEKYISNNTVLFKLAIAGLIGIAITNLTGEFVSRYVILLVVGVILSEIGFLDRSPLVKSQVFGFSMVVIVGYSVIDGLSGITPEILMSMIGPLIGIIVIGVSGLLLFAMIVGKKLG